MKFTNSRWKQPIERFRDDLYLYSPKGESIHTRQPQRAPWLARRD